MYVRGFFMWHWLDPARRYSTPIHKVSYSLLWSRDEEKCLALLVRNPRFSCKKIYFFLHHSDGGGEAPYKLFQNKEVQLDEICSIEKLQNFHFSYPECSIHSMEWIMKKTSTYCKNMQHFARWFHLALTSYFWRVCECIASMTFQTDQDPKKVK